MKYTSNLPDDMVNISNEHPLSVGLKLTLSLLFLAGVAYLILGFAIDYAVDNISPTQEKKLEELLSIDMNLSNEGSTYLSKVTNKLSKCANLPYDIGIHILNEAEPNAFAAPGGNIYITKGMLEKADSENELAFIIGHELGHFKHKDHLRTLGYKLILSMFGILIGKDYGVVANTTLNLGDARYSQKAELEADIYGLEVMNCAYGSVTNATKIFEKMDDNKEWQYFMATHPGFKKRIMKMKEKSIKDGFDTHKTVIPLEKF